MFFANSITFSRRANQKFLDKHASAGQAQPAAVLETRPPGRVRQCPGWLLDSVVCTLPALPAVLPLFLLDLNLCTGHLHHHTRAAQAAREADMLFVCVLPGQLAPLLASLPALPCRCLPAPVLPSLPLPSALPSPSSSMPPSPPTSFSARAAALMTAGGSMHRSSGDIVAIGGGSDSGSDGAGSGGGGVFGARRDEAGRGASDKPKSGVASAVPMPPSWRSATGTLGPSVARDCTCVIMNAGEGRAEVRGRGESRRGGTI